MVEKLFILIHDFKKISSNSALFCARLASKVANSTQKQFFIKKSIWISKNTEFVADFLNPSKMLQTSSYKKVVGIKREGVIWFCIF
jgi:hypothetical protein